MKKNLKIAALSLDIAPFSPSTNLRRIQAAMERLPKDVDVVVLPELFTTGYSDSPELLAANAEPNSGDTIAAVSRLAHDYNIAVAGSFLAKTQGDFYNRGFFIEPSGDEFYYDKKHLFGISTESKVFMSGESDSYLSVRFRGWNIALIICYDLRFPVWCRTDVTSPYDLLIVPANWPNAREYAWKHLLIARAIENQAFVAGVNREGTDEYGTYERVTFLFDYLGRPIGESVDMKDIGVVSTVAECNGEKMDKFRAAFPALEDADSFCFKKF